MSFLPETALRISENVHLSPSVIDYDITIEIRLQRVIDFERSEATEDQRFADCFRADPLRVIDPIDHPRLFIHFAAKNHGKLIELRACKIWNRWRYHNLFV